MKLFLLVISLAIAGVFSKSARSLEGALLSQEFANFMSTFNKDYSSPEEQALRLQVFAKNFDEIERLNLEAEQNGESVRFEVNEFADLSFEEFSSMYTGLIANNSSETEARDISVVSQIMRQTPPNARNWVQENRIGAIKNQGRCGSCWAFAVNSVLEASHAIRTGIRLSLSEQQLVDCDTGNRGCNGGNYRPALRYAQNGVVLSSAYPYRGVNGTCRFTGSGIAVRGGSFLFLNSEDAIRTYVGTRGPVAIGINATPRFQLYSSGILNDSTCGSSPPNHGVVVVGYGTENGVDFWLFRNSWGNRWGENAIRNGERGYMRFIRGRNICAINSMSVYAVTV